MNKTQNIFGNLHHHLVFQRRIQAIIHAIDPYILSGKVLDVGSGNGILGKMLRDNRKDIEIIGVDVHLRPKSYIPTFLYEDKLPFGDDEFSSVILIDVLHHTDDPIAVLKECLRVTKENIVIKDHFAENAYQFSLLKFMDWVGNRPHGVSLPYNYFSRKTWSQMLEECNVYEKNRDDEVPGLYPPLFYEIFGRKIHFVAEIKKESKSDVSNQ